MTQLEAMATATAQAWEGEGNERPRIGDAVSCRSIHSAILDAVRLCQNCRTPKGTGP
ncbi:MAG: hypothetical protein WAO78_12690 [Roseovarius sp.]